MDKKLLHRRCYHLGQPHVQPDGVLYQTGEADLQGGGDLPLLGTETEGHRQDEDRHREDGHVVDLPSDVVATVDPAQALLDETSDKYNDFHCQVYKLFT